MSHPSRHPKSCTDPNCTLSYRDHLVGISLSSAATPSRRPEAVQTNIRDQRWQDDHDAFRRLHRDGTTPPQIDGSRFRETHAADTLDITDRPVRVDHRTHGGDTWDALPAIEGPFPNPRR